jgi:hypothetical protein
LEDSNQNPFDFGTTLAQDGLLAGVVEILELALSVLCE